MRACVSACVRVCVCVYTSVHQCSCACGRLCVCARVYERDGEIERDDECVSLGAGCLQLHRVRVPRSGRPVQGQEEALAGSAEHAQVIVCHLLIPVYKVNSVLLLKMWRLQHQHVRRSC